jgi:hypothetical protein
MQLVKNDGSQSFERCLISVPPGVEESTYVAHIRSRDCVLLSIGLAEGARETWRRTHPDKLAVVEEAAIALLLLDGDPSSR